MLCKENPYTIVNGTRIGSWVLISAVTPRTQQHCHIMVFRLFSFKYERNLLVFKILSATLLFIKVMKTWKHRVNLQLPTLVPIAITVDTQHNVTFLAEREASVISFCVHLL